MLMANIHQRLTLKAAASKRPATNEIPHQKPFLTTAVTSLKRDQIIHIRADIIPARFISRQATETVCQQEDENEYEIRSVQPVHHSWKLL